MNFKDEILHHVFPGLTSAGAAFSLGEHFAFSVGVGVAVYCVTHVISYIAKTIIDKIRGKWR
jgi:hypothetical protein